MTDLIDQPTAAPTRKVAASAAAGGLATAIAAAVMGWLPESAQLVEGEIGTLINWALSLVFGVAATFTTGYMVRERAPQGDRS